MNTHSHHAQEEHIGSAPVGSRIDPVFTGEMPARRNRRPTVGIDEFVGRLRVESIYPIFRGFVQLFYVIGLLLAAACAIGGVVALLRTGGGMVALAVGIGLAVLLVLFARLFKETSLMLADMSDAMVRIARNQE